MVNVIAEISRDIDDLSRFVKPTYGVTPSPGGPGDLTKSK